jgi:hypothetical protein
MAHCPLLSRRRQILSLLHAAAETTTFTNDRGKERITDKRLQFGSIGVRQKL